MSLEIAEGRIVYRCGLCGVDDVKLWRRYAAFLDSQVLYCGRCASMEQKMPEIDLDAEGTHHAHWVRTDQIGYLIPAVLTADGSTFWGYTSAPEELVAAWKAMPTYGRNR